MEVSGQIQAPAAIIRGKDPDTRWTEDWVGPSAGPDAEEKTKNSFPAPSSNGTSVV
jgi:hypothetical protein